MLTVSINSDLVFEDADLEKEFRHMHTEAQKKLDIQFHYARSLTWGAVGLRMLKDSSAFRHYLAALTVLIGAVTTLLPAFTYKWLKPQRYGKVRPIVVVADNVLQFALGCFTHAHIYPENASRWQDASPWKAVAVYITGSGFAWCNMSGLLGSLIFRFAMPQQTILTAIMLLASPGICGRSYALQKAFVAIHLALARLAKRLIVPVLVGQAMQSVADIFRLPFDAITGVTEGADRSSEQWSTAAVDGVCPNDTLVAVAGSDIDGLAMCNTYQPLSLILLGLLAPTLYLFWRELRSRLQFVRQRAVAAGLRPEEVCVAPMPTIIDYVMYAVPAVVALCTYIITFG